MENVFGILTHRCWYIWLALEHEKVVTVVLGVYALQIFLRTKCANGYSPTKSFDSEDLEINTAYDSE